MHVLATVVGKRTEHWTDLFRTLVNQTDMTLTVCAADLSPLTVHALSELDHQQDRFQFRHLPHVLGERRTGHMASILFRPGSLRSLRHLRPDIVHIIGEASYLSAFQVVRLRNRYWPHTPVTLYAAQNTKMRLPTPFPHLERHAYRTVTHAFPITPAARAVLQAKGFHGPASVIPLGVDTEVFRPRGTTPTHRFTVGFVGRLEPHKGVADLLRLGELLDCDLLVVGDGSLREDVELAAARRPGHVELTAWLDHADLAAVMSRMDVLVLPAHEIIQRNVVPWIGIPLREQFGRVLIEAMACAIPVVGSDAGEIPHVIGDAGLTYPAGDVTALADRVTRIRDDQALAHTLAVNGRRRAVHEFAWTKIANTLHLVWRELADTADALTGVAPQAMPVQRKPPQPHEANRDRAEGRAR